MDYLGFSLEDLKKILINMGNVSYRKFDGYRVFSKNGIIFCVACKDHLYIRMTKNQFRYTKDSTELIKINDETYVFSRLDNSIAMTHDELLTMFTKVYWDLSGKTRILEF